MPSTDKQKQASTSWEAIKMVLPFVWRFRTRTLVVVVLLILSKVASVAVPMSLKTIVDVMSNPQVLTYLPVMLLVGYALLRFSTTLFGELRDAVFAKVTQNAISDLAHRVFSHLHLLGTRFHSGRQTGGVSRDIERGTRGTGYLLSTALFNIFPTLVEIGLVLGILLSKYEAWFSLIILATFFVYSAYTLIVTERRMIYRRAMNKFDSKANTQAIDSLINFETVKYFANEAYETNRFKDSMGSWAKAAVRNQRALSILHIGQSAIIAVGVAAVMLLAGQHVVNNTMTVGDLILINAYVIQVCLPLNLLGFVYREAKDAMTDMEKMLSLLREKIEVNDAPNARLLEVTRGEIRFEHVNFAYDERRNILSDVSLTIPAGKTVAIVGGSGAGKSTLSRLLFRFFDVSAGRIMIDGQDIREVTQKSLRDAIGIVPQDTVLFNDTIGNNIAYGRIDARQEEIVAAAKQAHIHHFIESLPEQYETNVGERGLKLSGGEKQRIAIARAILKNPPIIILDEATSALDSKHEKAIQTELKQISKNRTTLIVAHRLSTIVDADEIIVMERGHIIERGTHGQLLAENGVYAQMWRLQQQEKAVQEIEREKVAEEQARIEAAA